MSREASLQPSRPPIPKPVVTRVEVDGYTTVKAVREPFDLRDTEWAHYGQGGRTIYYAVANGRGAMSWRILLGEYVNDPQGAPTADALEWHYPPDMDRGFEGERDCDLIPGGKCRGDVGYMAGEPGLEHYLAGGDQAVLDWLRGICDEEFPRVGS